METVFLADLDNTLLYSYKHASEGDLCVEWLKGKEQGYMSPSAFKRLKALQETGAVIPVTSRSIEQYGRIQFPLTPRYAVVANGGYLLTDGVTDGEWRREAEAYIKPFLEEFARLQEALLATDLFIRVRTVDETFLFAYCKDGVDIHALQAEYEKATPLHVEASGRKLYFFPPRLNKGEACTRLKARLGARRVIAAGDSSIDAPMLSAADVAVVPKGYPTELIKEGVRVCVCEEERFNEFVLRMAEEFLSADEG